MHFYSIIYDELEILLNFKKKSPMIDLVVNVTTLSLLRYKIKKLVTRNLTLKTTMTESVCFIINFNGENQILEKFDAKACM